MECELSDDRLVLRLTEGAAGRLRTPTEIDFGLALDSTKLEVLRRGLRRVLTSGRANAVPHVWWFEPRPRRQVSSNACYSICQAVVVAT